MTTEFELNAKEYLIEGLPLYGEKSASWYATQLLYENIDVPKTLRPQWLAEKITFIAKHSYFSRICECDEHVLISTKYQQIIRRVWDIAEHFKAITIERQAYESKIPWYQIDNTGFLYDFTNRSKDKIERGLDKETYIVNIGKRGNELIFELRLLLKTFFHYINEIRAYVLNNPQIITQYHILDIIHLQIKSSERTSLLFNNTLFDIGDSLSIEKLAEVFNEAVKSNRETYKHVNLLKSKYTPVQLVALDHFLQHHIN